MGKKCFIPNCNSGYPSCREKISIFGAPKDEKTLEKWRRVIPRKDRLFSTKDFVCAKHFREEDIQKEWTDGFNHIPLKVFRLKEGVYPTIFPNCPSYLNVNMPKKRRLIVKHDIIESKKTKTTDSTTDPVLIQVTENDNIDTSIDTISSTDIHSEVPPSTSKTLFHTIMNDETFVSLPNEFWSISKVANEIEPCVVFLKLIFSNDVPVIEKQVVVTESLNIRLFIHGKLLSNNMNSNIVSPSDISKIIDELELSNVCRGVTVENENMSENAKKRKIAMVDNCNVLRHKNCTITTSGGKICSYCVSLNRNLRNATKKNQIKVVQSKLRNKQKQNIRLRKRLNQYEREMKRTRENISKLNEAELENKLSELRIPSLQKLLIRQCLVLCKQENKKNFRYN